jgi:MurNAc alpha-1-phosphate uridylyltransferase
MILAAGRGERMRPLTDRTPKPLLQAGGKALIEYHLERFHAAGIHEILINVAWLGAQIREALGDGSRYGVQIAYSDEGSHALETGGGIYKALPLLGPEPFIVVSGDVWVEYPYAELALTLAPDDLAHLVLVPNPPFHPRGDFGLQQGRIVAAGERPYTYANVGIYRPELFAGCQAGRFALAPLLYQRIGRLGGELFTGRWHNLGNPAQLGVLDAELRQAQ